MTIWMSFQHHNLVLGWLFEPQLFDGDALHSLGSFEPGQLQVQFLVIIQQPAVQPVDF